jgi:hypothetical protein
MIALPPISIQIGLPFSHDIVWDEDGVPVNMTGWTGSVTFKKTWGGDTVLTVAPTLGAAGQIEFDLTATQTESLPSLQRLGEMKTGFYQISVSNGSTGQIFQGELFTSAQL